MSQKNWLFSSVDPSREQALFSWMIDQCKDQHKSLVVLVVLPQLSHKIFAWFEHEQHQDVMQKQTDSEKRKRDNWQKMADAAGVEYSVQVCFGKLFYEVVQYADQHQVELLVKQAEDIKQSEGVLFQSVDWHLLRKSTVPLLLYREQGGLPFEKVMVSMDVDIDIQPYQVSELNQNLLLWGRKQVQQAEDLTVVHAWQADLENLVRHWDADLNDETLISLSEELYFEHKQAMNVELQESGLADGQAKVLMCKGEPAESIASAVEEQGVDLLVLGTLARQGVAGLLIGNTAEDLLERVNCSVLAIKPQGFKSPII